MVSSHYDIKEKLSECIKGGLLPDEVKEHLKTCSECREDAFIIKAIHKDHVPDPGGMFFETLPQKVKASVHFRKRNNISRFATAFALIVLLVTLVTAGYFYHSVSISGTDEVYAFNDPLSQPVYDLGSLHPDDVPLIDELIGEVEIFLDESSFIMEFAYLDADEIEGLFKALGNNRINGGVL